MAKKQVITEEGAEVSVETVDVAPAIVSPQEIVMPEPTVHEYQSNPLSGECTNTIDENGVTQIIMGGVPTT